MKGQGSYSLRAAERAQKEVHQRDQLIQTHGHGYFLEEVCRSKWFRTHVTRVLRDQIAEAEIRLTIISIEK